MSIFLTIILAVQMLSALGMIGLILIQHGKGADMGAAFGSGGSGSLFGASGSANFMSRATSILAAVFFGATLLLSYFGSVRSGSTGSVLEGTAVTTPATSVPIAPAGPAGQIPGNAPVPPVTTPAPSSSPVPSSSSSTVPAPVTVAPATPVSTAPSPATASNAVVPPPSSKGASQIPTK